MKLTHTQTRLLRRDGWRKEEDRWVHPDVKDPTDGRRLFRCSNAVALVVQATVAAVIKRTRQRRAAQQDLNGEGRLELDLPVNL